MNKIKTLKILCSLLVTINIGLIAFMVIKKKSNFPKHKKAGERLKEAFGFDDDQMLDFAKIRDVHRERSRYLSKLLTSTSKRYYKTVEDKNRKQILLDSIIEVSNQVYLNNEKHFNDLRSICTTDQLKNMNEFIDELIDRRDARNGKKSKGKSRKEKRKRKRNEG